MINNIHDFCNYFGTTEDNIEKDIFKYTECGAFIKYDDSKIIIGSIVEGWDDGEILCDPLYYPFEEKEFDTTLEWLECEAEAIWHEVNDFEETDYYYYLGSKQN